MTSRNEEFHEATNNPIPDSGLFWHNQSYVDYTHNPKKNTLKVNYMKSSIEGKGDAQKALRKTYQQFPKAHVSYTKFLHPAAEHIAKKMANEFGRTTIGKQTWL